MGQAPDSGAQPQDQAADAAAGADGAPAEIDDQLRRQICGFAELLPELNYYEVLGVPRDASSEAIRDAFFERSKRFHPDRHFGKELGVYGDLLHEIYKRVTVAHEVLRDEQLREQYDGNLDAPPSDDGPAETRGDDAAAGAGSAPATETPTEEARQLSLRERPRRNLGLTNLANQIRLGENAAAKLYGQADRLVREGAWERAVETLRLAMAHAPREPLYHEALAEIVPLANEARAEAAQHRGAALLERGKRAEAIPALQEAAELRPMDAALSHRVASLLLDAGGDAESAMRFADRAAQLEDANPAYRKTLGRAYKAAGKLDEARREFERVIILDPKDKEVKAELVLL